jgi:hypothetical protein
MEKGIGTVGIQLRGEEEEMGTTLVRSWGNQGNCGSVVVVLAALFWMPPFVWNCGQIPVSREQSRTWTCIMGRVREDAARARGGIKCCSGCQSWCRCCPQSIVKAVASGGVLWFGQLEINPID